MLHIFSSCQRKIKSVSAIIIGFVILIGLAGCGDSAYGLLETYHSEDYRFSISVDKELMDYIEVEKNVVEGEQGVRLDFFYVDE